MENKFYTVDQIAEILGMHHKTIRKFITEGKLRANKVGKQWRISGHDLSNFMENNNVKVINKTEVDNEKIEFSTSEIDINKKVNKIKNGYIKYLNILFVQMKFLFRRFYINLIVMIKSIQKLISVFNFIE